MKKNTMKRAVVIGLSLTFTVGLFSGCAGQEKQASGGKSDMAKGVIAYPVESGETLTYFKTLNGNVSGMSITENDTEFTKELRERTGINVVFDHPPANQAAERFNLMLASSNLPDIVDYDLYTTNEGPDKLITSGYVYEMTPEFLKNYAPNFYTHFESGDKKDLVRRVLTTEDGRLYSFMNMVGDESMLCSFGLVIRKDWLDELGLGVPETIDEWHTVLTAFRDRKAATAPLTFKLDNILQYTHAFVGAFDTTGEIHLDGDRVVYGPLKEGYRDFVETLRTWFAEGLIDKNLASPDTQQMTAQLVNGQSGAGIAWIGSGLGEMLKAKKDDPTYNLVAAPFPVLNKGERAEYGYFGDLIYRSPWISATSENKELAARFLDYGFSQDGKMFYNFGTEGQSYTLEDGNPVYTDLITNNPKNLSTTQALTMYTHCTFNYPGVSDVRFYRQQYPFQQQIDAIDTWGANNQSAHYLYGDNYISREDFSEYNNLASELKTYLEEKTLRYIMGLESMESYDEFQRQLHALGADRVMEIRQAGYDKFIAN